MNGLTGTVRIAAGTGTPSATLALRALVDADTGAETLRFAITASGSNYTISNTMGGVDIAIVQPTPEISVTASATSATEGGAAVTLTVRSNVSLGTPLTVSYGITGVVATDFRLDNTASQSGLTGTVEIAAGTGTPSATLTLRALVDADTGAETLIFAIADGVGYTVSSSNGAVNIAITQLVPEISVSVMPASVTEGGTAATLTVTSNVPLGAALVVSYRITGTGIDVTDFRLDNQSGLTGTVEIAAGTGTPSATLSLRALVDVDTGAETLRFAIADGMGYTVSGSNGMVNIPIMQPTPEISIASSHSVVAEGGSATLTVSSNVALGSDLTVSYEIRGTGIDATDFRLTDAASQAADRLSGTITIPRGGVGTERRLTLMAVNDTDATEQTLTFTIIAGTGYTVSSNGSVDVAIQPLPEISVTASATSVTEDGEVTLTVSATPAPAAALTVSYEISGTGISTTDFDLAVTASQNGLRGTISIPTSGSHTLTLTAENDTDATNQTLSFAIVAGTGYTISSNGSVNVTIQPLPEISVTASATRVTEGNSVTLTVRASPAPAAALTVNYSISGVSATDFTLTNTIPNGLRGTIRIPTSGSQTLTLTAEDDTDTSNETLAFAITAGTGYAIGSNGSVNVVIEPLAPTPEISVTASATSVAEGGEVTLTVRATPAPASRLTVSYRVAGTGIGSTDFRLAGTSSPSNLTGTFSIAANATMATLTLMALDDTDTSNQTLSFTITARTGYTIGSNGSVNVTIRPLPQISVTASATRVTEGNDVTLTVRANPAPASMLTVSYRITGTANGADFGLSGTFSQAGNELSGTIRIPTSGSQTLTLTADDDTDTSNETLAFAITAGTGYAIGSNGSVNVVIEPLPPTPEISVTASATRVTEGNSVTLTVRATPPPAATLTVSYGITGTANGVDFGLSGAFSQAGNELSGTIRIPTGGSRTLTLTAEDDTDTSNETLAFAITAGAGYTIGSNGSVNVVIEPAVVVMPEISITASASTVTEGGRVMFTVTANPAPSSALTVNYGITGVSATDFTLLGAAQAANGLSGTISVPTGGSIILTMTAVDDTDSSNETLAFAITAGTGYTIGSNRSASVTIQPAAPPPPATTPEISVMAGSDSVTEGGDVTLTVSANPAPAAALTVSYRITGTGISSTDFRLTGTSSPSNLTGTLTIAANATRETLTLTALDDTDGSNQTLTFAITTGAGYTISSGSNGSANVTIRPATGQTPVISVMASSNTVTAGGFEPTSTVTVTATPAPASALTVSYRIVGTGIDANDFILSGVSTQADDRLSGTVIIPSTGSVALTMRALRSTDRASERWEMLINDGNGYTVSNDDGQISITITSGDPPPEISVGPGTSGVAEGGAAAMLTVRASTTSIFPLTVSYRITGVSATDFSLAGTASQSGLTGTLTIAGRATSAVLVLSALVDSDSGEETLVFTITNGPGYTVSSGSAAANVIIGNPGEVPGVTAPNAPEFYLGYKRTTVQMGYEALGVNVIIANGTNLLTGCDEPIRYSITTNPPSLASNVGLEGRSGTIPCGVPSGPASSHQSYRLTTLTMQQQHSATITVTLLPSQRNPRAYTLRPGGESFTVTVLNQEYKPKAGMSVGDAASGLRNFTSIVEGGSTTINYKVFLNYAYPGQPSNRTFRINVPLVFRISGNAPARSFSLTEHGTNRAITIGGDNTFSVTVPAGTTATRGINIIAADNLDGNANRGDTYRVVIDLVGGRSEYDTDPFTRGVVELAEPASGTLPRLAVSVNNTSISHKHTDPARRTAVISIRSSVTVTSPLTIRYTLATTQTLSGRYYALSYNGNVFDGYNGTSIVSPGDSNSLQLDANRNNWQIILTPVPSSHVDAPSTQNLVFWLQPAAGYVASASSLPDASTTAVDVDINDLRDEGASSGAPAPPRPALPSARLKISYGGDVIAGDSVGVVIENANGNVASDLVVNVRLDTSDVGVGDVTFTNLAGSGNMRTATIPRGTNEVVIRVAASAGVTRRGFVELSITPGNGYYSIFGGRSGLYIIPPGASSPTLSVSSNRDRIIAGASTATITVSSTLSVPANTQLYYQIRTQKVLSVYNLMFNGAAATSPVTISGAGPWTFTLSAPHTGYENGTVEEFIFFVDYGLGYDAAGAGNDRVAIDIVHAR